VATCIDIRPTEPRPSERRDQGCNTWETPGKRLWGGWRVSGFSQWQSGRTNSSQGLQSRWNPAERYLEDLVRRYGGIDSVLVWRTGRELLIRTSGLANRRRLFRSASYRRCGIRESRAPRRVITS